MPWVGITMSINLDTGKINKSAPSFKGGVQKTLTVGKGLQTAVEKAGGLSTPANRLFLGATALSIQPEIDLHNKDVDKDTQKVSAARTAAKIIAGTLTGVPIRALCIKAIDLGTCTDEKELSKLSESARKWKTMFVPTNVPIERFKNAERLLKKHKQAIGSIVALLVMLFTNFALDVPITKFLTNFFVDKVNKKEQQPEMKGGN